LFEECPVHGDELETVVFCKYCNRPMSEEYHKVEYNKMLKQYQDMRKIKEDGN